MVEVIQCPIETAFHRTSLHKKWTLTIIRDLILGIKHFNEYLKTNEGLSAKVLSQRLKEMEEEGLILKSVVSTTPIVIEYTLTEKGLALNRILYEFSMYGSKYYPQQVFGVDEFDMSEVIDIFGGGFMLPPEEVLRLKTPKVEKLDATA